MSNGIDNSSFKLGAFGLDINISEVIGESIVKQWMSKLSEEDMKSIFKAIDDEVFNTDTVLSTDAKVKRKFKKTQPQNDWAYGGCSRDADTPIWRMAKEKLMEKLGDDILDRVNKIIDSEAYIKRADQIATEIVDYATEGYKQDLMSRIRERLVDGVLSNEPIYHNISLREIIRDEISNCMGR